MKVVGKAPESMRTLLAATVGIENTYASAVVQDVQKVAAYKQFEHMPSFAADPHKWTDFMLMFPGEFASIIDEWVVEQRRHCQLEASTACEQHEELLVHRDPYLPVF